MKLSKQYFMALFFVAGCFGRFQDEGGSVPVPGELVQPSLCGTSPIWKEIQSVSGGSEIEKVIRQRARLVGRLSWGSLVNTNWTNTDWAVNHPICTATLVDPTHVLTAGHCFLSHSGWPQVGDRVVTPEEAAAQMVVRFGFQAGGTVQEPNKEVAVTALEDLDIQGQDFALLRIQQAVDDGYWQPGDVPTFNFDWIEAGADLAIVQHPMGREKVAATGQVIKVSYDELWHSVDTDNGSSGAAVFDAKSRIVAVHTRGGCETGGNVARIAFHTFAESPNLLCLAARNEAYRRREINFETYMSRIGENRAPWSGYWLACSFLANRLLDDHMARNEPSGGGDSGGDGGTAGDGGVSGDGGSGGSDAELCSQLRESVRLRVSPEEYSKAQRNNWAPVYWSCVPPLDQQQFTFADCGNAIELRCGGPNR